MTPARLMMRAFLLIGAGLSVALAAGAAEAEAAPKTAAQLPAGITEVRSLGGIVEYRLERNGLQILLMPVLAAPRASVTISYRVGSRHEAANEAGMAHLLEHVTFRGAADGSDLGSALQRLGARFNGTTTSDRTNYFSSFAADGKVLRGVLQLEALRMHGARLAQADFDKEKPIVLNEMALSAEGTATQMHQAIIATAFRQHPYGRPVIGFSRDIEQLSLPRLRAFYEHHYRLDNAVLMVAGGFDADAALAAVAEFFGPLQDPAEPLQPQAALAEPLQQLPRVMTLRTGESALAVAWRVPGMAHEDAPALRILDQYLPGIGGWNARDKERQVSVRAIAQTGLTREPFLLGRIVQLPLMDTSRPNGRRAMQSLEDEWLSELQEARDGNRVMDYQVLQIADDNARHLEQALGDPEQAPALISDAVGAGDWRLPFKLVLGLRRLKPADVYRAWDRYLRSENRSVVRGVTDAAVQAPEFREEPLGFFAGLFSKPVDVPLVQDPAVRPGQVQGLGPRSAGDAFETDPAVLDKTARRYSLPSGTLVGTLSKKSADDSVTVLLRLRWGQPRAMAKLQGWRPLAAMLDDGSTGRTPDQIYQLAKMLHADIRVLSGAQGVTVTVTSRQSSLVQALVLTKELLMEPRLPAGAFKREQDAALARLASGARGGHGAFELERAYRMAQLGLHAGDPGYVPSNAELTAIWRELTVEDVRQFHRRFWSANDAVVTVAGQSPDKIFAVVETLFGNWKKPGADAFEAAAPAYRPVQAARIEVAAAGGRPGGGAERAAAQVVMQQDLPLNREEPDCLALRVGARILAGAGGPGGPLGNRLADRLRGQDALSYAISADLEVPERGSQAQLRLVASGAPASAGRVETAMKDEIARLLRDGVTPAELDEARRQVRAEQRQRLSSDTGLALALMEQLDRKSSFQPLAARDDAALEALTPERVVEVMRRLLPPDHWVTVLSGSPGKGSEGDGTDAAGAGQGEAATAR